MGTVAEKLTYLNTTKQDIKQAINNLGGSITSSTTFRNYASQLDTIYDNLPKVSDTGTNVSLSPTLKGRLGIVPKGNTYQESTTGKNSWSLNSSYRTATGSEYVLRDTILATIPAGTYILSLKKSVNANVLFTFKDSLNSATDKILNNTEEVTVTFSNDIVKAAIYIYGNTECTISNIMIRPSSITDDTYEPYTGGQASPNPSYQQEIQSATGTQNITISGKNKFNTLNKGIEDENIATEIISNNEVKVIYDGNSSTYKRTRFIISGLKENTDYKFKANIQNSNSSVTRNWLVIRNSNDTSSLYSARYISDNIATFNTGSNTTIICGLYAVGEDAVTNNTATWSDIILAEDVSTYQPYITPVSKTIELSSRNKFDISTIIENKALDLANGKVNVNANDRNTSDFISIKSSTQYVCNETMKRYAFYDEDKTFISSGINNTTFTTPNNAKYFRFSYDNSLTNIQLVEGSTAPSSYIPYYNYSLNNIPNTDYEDYITGTPDNWVYKKNIGKVVLDGSESWGIGNQTYYIDNFNGKPYTTFSDSDVFAASNYFKWGNGSTGTYIYGSFWYTTNGTVLRFIKDENPTNETLAQFKTWLSTHNTEVLYPLATETTIPITDTNLVSQLNELYYLMSYDDTTNIDVSGNLPMRITASAIKGA